MDAARGSAAPKQPKPPRDPSGPLGASVGTEQSPGSLRGRQSRKTKPSVCAC